jgi:hypothetical protein
LKNAAMDVAALSDEPSLCEPRVTIEGSLERSDGRGGRYTVYVLLSKLGNAEYAAERRCGGSRRQSVGRARRAGPASPSRRLARADSRALGGCSVAVPASRSGSRAPRATAADSFCDAQPRAIAKLARPRRGR